MAPYQNASLPIISYAFLQFLLDSQQFNLLHFGRCLPCQGTGLPYHQVPFPQALSNMYAKTTGLEIGLTDDLMHQFVVMPGTRPMHHLSFLLGGTFSVIRFLPGFLCCRGTQFLGLHIYLLLHRSFDRTSGFSIQPWITPLVGSWDVEPGQLKKPAFCIGRPLRKQLSNAWVKLGIPCDLQCTATSCHIIISHTL